MHFQVVGAEIWGRWTEQRERALMRAGAMIPKSTVWAPRLRAQQQVGCGYA